MSRPDPPAVHPAPSVGSRITQLRSSRGWSQNEVSRRSGIDSGRLSRIVRGVRDPTIRELLQLRETFSVSVDELLLGASEMGAELTALALRLGEVAPPEEAKHLLRVMALGYTTEAIQRAGGLPCRWPD